MGYSDEWHFHKHTKTKFQNSRQNQLIVAMFSLLNKYTIKL